MLVYQIQIIWNCFLCLSVYQLAYSLTEIRKFEGYLHFWMIYISEIFWRHSLDVVTPFPNNSEILVYLSVCYLANFLTETRQIQEYLQFWMSYLSEFFDTFLGCWHPNSNSFLYFLYVSQSVSWLTFLLKLDKYRDIFSSG